MIQRARPSVLDPQKTLRGGGGQVTEKKFFRPQPIPRPILGPSWAGSALEDPWRRTDLMPGWCGNGPIMVLKSIGVGLDRFGAEWRRFWSEFGRFFSIWGHFGAILGPC